MARVRANHHRQTYVAKIEIPFDHSDVQVLVDSMFSTAACIRWRFTAFRRDALSWIKAGIVQDPAALQALVLKGIDGLIETTPTAASLRTRTGSQFAAR